MTLTESSTLAQVRALPPRPAVPFQHAVGALARGQSPNRSSVSRRAVLTALALIPLAGCTEESLDAPAGGLVIASGSRQGVYFNYASEFERAIEAELPGLAVRIVPTDGSIDDLQRIADGTAQLGFATADTAYEAVKPAPSFRVPRNLRAIARIYDEYIHLVAKAGSPVRTIADLRGRTVSTGPPRSSADFTVGRILDVAGLRPGRDFRQQMLSLDDAIPALRAGTVDAFFWSGGLPTKGIQDLAGTVPIHLVSLANLVTPLQEKYGSVYRSGAVIAGTYSGVDTDTVTVAVPNYLILDGGLDDELVHALTRVLFERRGQIAHTVPSGQLLDARSAISTMPIPLHPGAQRYYQEIKP